MQQQRPKFFFFLFFSSFQMQSVLNLTLEGATHSCPTAGGSDGYVPTLQEWVHGACSASPRKCIGAAGVYMGPRVVSAMPAIWEPLWLSVSELAASSRVRRWHRGSKHCAMGPSTAPSLAVNMEGAREGEPAVSCIAKAAFSLGSFSWCLVAHHLRSYSKWSGEKA